MKNLLRRLVAALAAPLAAFPLFAVPLLLLATSAAVVVPTRQAQALPPGCQASWFDYGYVLTTQQWLTCLGGGGSGVTGPPSSVVNDVACWNNTLGSVLNDCGAFPAALTVPNSNLIGGDGTSLLGVAVGAGLGFGSSTLNCSAATNSARGCVEPDGTIITVSGGAITVPKASSSVFGVVEVDNSSVTASAGVISAVCSGITHAGCLNVTNVWSATQSDTVQTVSVSTTTYTPASASGNDITISISHTTCAAAACTFANPSGTVVPGTHGVIQMIQDSTGGGSIGTWGSDYIANGGTASLTQSSGASERDFYSYYVADSTHIVIAPGVLDATH